MRNILLFCMTILLLGMLGCEDANEPAKLKEAADNPAGLASETPQAQQPDAKKEECAGDSCITQEAIEKKDHTICNQIISVGAKNDCLYSVGTSERSSTACSKITDLTKRNKCYSAIGYVEPKKEVELKTTYQSTGKSVCTENGVPIVRLYGASYCPHCRWVAQTYYAVAKEYADRGLIKAYYWELNGGDDLMTDAIAGEMREEDIDFYNKNNPNGVIPYFNLGCAYERFGNGYEGEDDGAKKEEAELRKMIDALIAKLINQES